MDRKTVKAVRRRLESGRKIPKVKVFRGKDGKKYRFTTVPTESAAHARQAANALRKLGKKHSGKVIRAAKAARLARYLQYEEYRNGHAMQGTGSKNIKLVCCDFRSLDVQAVDLIFTEIWDMLKFLGHLPRVLPFLLAAPPLIVWFASLCRPAAASELSSVRKGGTAGNAPIPLLVRG